MSKSPRTPLVSPRYDRSKDYLDGAGHPTDLNIPQFHDDDDDDVDESSTPTYRIRHRQRTTSVSEDSDDEIYLGKPKPMTPVRSRFASNLTRSPKTPNRSPMRPSRSPLRSNQSPVSPRSPGSPFQSDGNGVWKNSSKTSKRQFSCWTVLFIAMLGPTILFAGYYFSQGTESDQPIAHSMSHQPPPPRPLPPIVLPPIDGAPTNLTRASMLDQDSSRILNANRIFIVQNEALNPNQRKYLGTYNQGIFLQQQVDGNLVLYSANGTPIWNSGYKKAPNPNTMYMTVMQGDGNLVTRAMTFDAATYQWTPKPVWSTRSRMKSGHSGGYLLMLTPNSDGLMIVRVIDNKVIWSTVKVGPLAPRSPTPQPVAPTLRPTPHPSMKPIPSVPMQTQVDSTKYDFPDTVPRSEMHSLQSGPMIGHTTDSSCKVWIYLGKTLPMQVVYWPRNNYGARKTITMIPDTQANGAAISTIQNLQADTTYLYEVRISSQWLSRGHFKTAPRSGRGTSFKYALASCMNVKSNYEGFRQQPVWNRILEENIDFAMLPGDTVYLNYLDWTRQGEVLYGRVWYRYLQQRAERHFAGLIKTTPTYGVWDNHDYGMEYAERGQMGKENSLKAWAHLWPNPYQGSSKGKGNYYSYSWGDVDFFVLDCRWYRNSWAGTLFGQAQIDWLAEKLVASNAVFKIIVSASDVMEKDMTRDLQAIGSVVRNNRISGVLFNAGDIHRNEYKSQWINNWPYKVHQFTSSGVAVVWRRPFAIINVDTTLSDPIIRAEFFTANSQSSNPVWYNSRNVVCSQIQGTNRDLESRCTETIRLSQLTPR